MDPTMIQSGKTIAVLKSMLAAAALLLALPACQKVDYVVVHLEGPSSISFNGLGITVVNGGHTGTAEIDKGGMYSPPQSFWLSIDPSQHTGEAAITVIAKLDGQEVARGSGNTTLVDHGQVDVTIALGSPQAVADMAGAGVDMAGVNDLATPPDLTPPLWTSLNGNTTAELYGVWAQGSTFIAAGDALNGMSRGIFLRSDNAGNNVTTALISQYPLYAVWGVSPNQTYAVGHSDVSLENTGKGWLDLVGPPGGSGDWLGISGPASELYVVGGDNNSGVSVASANDFKMNVVFSNNPTRSALRSVSAVHGMAFAAQADGTIVGSKDMGITWTQRGPRWQNQLNGVWLRSPEVVVVGAGGLIVYSPDGVGFSQQASGIATDLSSVWCSASDCFAVGASGVVLHTSGNGWQLEATSTNADLRGVFGTATAVYAVGAGGTILARALK